MGTTTRKIRKKSGTRTSTRISSPAAPTVSSAPAGRRGSATRSIHVEEIEIPEAQLNQRIQAAAVDIIFILGLSELFFTRKAYLIYTSDSESFTARATIYVLIYFFLYLIPLRFFGQTLGMKLKKIKILNKSDLEFVKFSQIIQRQTAGMILSATAGLTLLMQKKLLADEIFKTIVTNVVEEKKQEETEEKA